MKIWRIVVPGLLGLALAGCRSDPTVAWLERDNSKKQWEIHQLRKRIEDLEDALNAAAPVQPGIITRGLPAGEMPPEPGTMDGGRFGPAGTAPPYTRPGGTNPQPETFSPGGLDISPGTEAPPGEVPDRMRAPGQGPTPRVSPPAGPAFGGASPDKSSRWSPAGDQPLVGNLALADNNQVFQITLHPALTGGIGSGGRPSDEGLLVVVEPRDLERQHRQCPGRYQRGPARPGSGGRAHDARAVGFCGRGDPRDDPHRLATRYSSAIALDFHAGPRSAEGLCPLYDPRWPEASGRTVDWGRPEQSPAGPA